MKFMRFSEKRTFYRFIEVSMMIKVNRCGRHLAKHAGNCLLCYKLRTQKASCNCCSNGQNPTQFQS